MRAVDYVTHGFGGWTDILASQEFKDAFRQAALRGIDPGYFTSPSGPAGASVAPTGPTPRTPAEAVQARLVRAGYPASVTNAAFSAVNRYGVYGLNRTLQFIEAYGAGLNAFRASGIGPAVVARVGLKAAYIQVAQSAFNSAASRFGLDPLSKAIRDTTLSEMNKARSPEAAGDAMLYIPGGIYEILKGRNY